MNLKQIRDNARLRLDDLRPENYGWSDQELNGYINEAANEAAIRSRSIVDSTSTKCSRITTISGTATYTINPSVFFIDRVYDATNKLTLTKTSFNELDDNDSKWQDRSGKPTHYIDDLNHYGDDISKKRSITLYPNPDSAIALHLTVYRTHLEVLTDYLEPELPIYQHADLIYWVLHLAYLKQDADTLNIDKSLEFYARFDQCFGEKQDARKLEWRRKHRVIRVKGNYL